jgi:glycine cleavage system H protein
MTTMFTPDHEWINIEDHEAAVVGITLHAQDALGDVVFVDLPEVGRTYKKGEVAGVVESVKAAADLFMPVAARSSRSTRRCAPTRRWPTATRWATAGSSRCRSPTWTEFDQLMDPPATTRCSRRSDPPVDPRLQAARLSAAAPPCRRRRRPEPCHARLPTLAALENAAEFAARHIGPDAADEAHMLSAIGAAVARRADRRHRAAQHRARRPMRCRRRPPRRRRWPS